VASSSTEPVNKGGHGGGGLEANGDCRDWSDATLQALWPGHKPNALQFTQIEPSELLGTRHFAFLKKY
jgi:hypothetical protein